MSSKACRNAAWYFVSPFVLASSIYSELKLDEFPRRYRATVAMGPKDRATSEASLNGTWRSQQWHCRRWETTLP